MKYLVVVVVILLFFFLISINTNNNTTNNTTKFYETENNDVIVDIVWSKGYPLFFNLKNKDYIFSGTEKLISKNDIVTQKGNRYIWIKMGTKKINKKNINKFIENINTFDYPFILITTDGDSSIPLDLDQKYLQIVLNNKNLITWYTQNISDNQYDKLKPIPIGLDLYTIKNSPQEQLDEIYKIRDNSPPEKKLKIFCDVHLSKNKNFGNPREQVEKLKYDTIEYLPNRIPREQLWKEYTNYAFVISTHGNGLDCHRTWEILLLGSIVITKTSSIDSLFQNLPVVIVKDWEELNDSTNLKKWYDTYIPLTKDIENKLKIRNFITN